LALSHRSSSRFYCGVVGPVRLGCSPASCAAPQGGSTVEDRCGCRRPLERGAHPRGDNRGHSKRSDRLHARLCLRDVARSLPANAQTHYEIGSITKQFTAAAILQCKETGKIDLDATLATYLPSISHAKEITIRQLLTHSSGLEDYVDIANFETLASTPATFDQLLSRVSSKPLAFIRGTHFAYSNTNYLILGRIIELASGQTWEAYVKEHLFAPAGMTESATMAEEGQLADTARGYTYTQGHIVESKPIAESWASSAGGIVSTTEDLQKWGVALTSGQIISSADYELLTKSAQLSDGTDSGYGFGIKIDLLLGEPRFLHDGDSDRAVSPGILSPLSGHFHGATSEREKEDRLGDIQLRDATKESGRENSVAMKTELLPGGPNLRSSQS